MHITLKQLQVFQAVSQHQQVSLAAKALFITQPAASMALRELEKQLGVKLFDRLGNRLVINSNGRHLQPYVRDLLYRATDIEQLFSSANNALSGTLLVGCSLTIGNHLMPSLLSQMQKQMPAVTPKAFIQNTQSLLEQLLHFKLDIALVEGRCQHPDLISIPWREDNMLIVAAPNCPHRNQSLISLEQLQDEVWVLREQGSGSRDIFDDLIAPSLDNRYRVFEIQHTEAIVNSVQEGLGITCISHLSVHRQLQSGELITLPVSGINLHRQMHIVLHKDRAENKTLKSFIDLCRENAGCGDIFNTSPQPVLREA
ncbi:LysR substrate-binding domain-containing protein [Parendozoicomonas haliclonae]|nr:LysR substrate-binding domain-containing protein [Parendozoicomonas haliclonae]